MFVSCKQEKDYYVFTSFHEPATDGLRFLYSADGVHWDSIAGTWLKPEIGKQQIMRDPSMYKRRRNISFGVDTSWRAIWFWLLIFKDLIHGQSRK
jgi:hypothetical protein